MEWCYVTSINQLTNFAQPRCGYRCLITNVQQSIPLMWVVLHIVIYHIPLAEHTNGQHNAWLLKNPTAQLRRNMLIIYFGFYLKNISSFTNTNIWYYTSNHKNQSQYAYYYLLKYFSCLVRFRIEYCKIDGSSLISQLSTCKWSKSSHPTWSRNFYI